MAAVPGAEEHLRCRIKWVRDDGPEWVSMCWNPEVPWAPPEESCTASPEATLLSEQCRSVVYCAGGSRVQGGRCDRRIECSDQSDELGCFPFTGRDWFWCDPELMEPRDVCRYGGDCGLEKTPPVCDPMRPETYLCDDGGEVSVETVCDRAQDCADASDERYCFK
jgi:hypothetical protein